MGRKRSEADALRGRIRELEGEMKRLRKSAKKANRLEHMVDNFTTPEEAVGFVPKREKPQCPECGSKEYEVVDLVVRDLCICDDCGYRKTFPKKKGTQPD